MLKAYAIAVTDRNSKALLLQRAEKGDAKSFFEDLKKTSVLVNLFIFINELKFR